MFGTTRDDGAEPFKHLTVENDKHCAQAVDCVERSGAVRQLTDAGRAITRC